MTKLQWDAFCRFRDEFKEKVEEWAVFSEELKPLQKNAAESDTPEYVVETSVVYNSAMDDMSLNDDIKIIMIGDNPGKDEQKFINRKYLVGQSGKIAEGFFRRNSELGIDFRKNVLILNKTPIHTAKTLHLRYLKKYGSVEIQNLIEESQIWMAEKTAKLHKDLFLGKDRNSFATELWLVGYSELKKKGIFDSYKRTLQEFYAGSELWENVFVFRHFSMNSFSNNLTEFKKNNPSKTILEALYDIGNLHKAEIFS